MELTGPALRHKRQQLGLSQAKLSEFTGVPQHLLSAFELSKVELSAELLFAISSAMTQKEKVISLATRNKRYREHQYDAVPRVPERVAKANRTPGNFEYLQVLEKLALGPEEDQEYALSALSLFSGCGGFSLGFSAAGFDVKGFLEIDPGLRRIYRDNFPRSRELGGDITLTSQKILSDIVRSMGSIDVIIGGPPCQGFSLSGKRQVEDPRNTLFKHYLRFVDALRPKMAIMENVRLLTSMKNLTGGLIKDEILYEFDRHGYRIKLCEINAKDYGVPQHRERLLFVAVRKEVGLDPSIPPPTHGRNMDLFSGFQNFRTFADACSDLPYLEAGEKSGDPLHEAVKHPKHVIEWLWDVKEGRSAHDNENPNKRPPSGYNTTYKRQVWNEPASTVQTTFGMISGCRNVHPVATRSLTIREAARIQSFPDSYKFNGTLGDIRKGIGNAVPPILAFSLAQHTKKLLSDFVEIASL